MRVGKGGTQPTLSGHVQRWNTSDLHLPSCAALLRLVGETALLWSKQQDNAVGLAHATDLVRGILGPVQHILKDRTAA